MFPGFEDFKEKRASITVLGLGYVGLPLAYYLEKKFDVTGFDINGKRVSELLSGNDITGEISKEELASSSLKFTTDASVLKDARVIIATVPTPVNDDKEPDLSIIRASSMTIGKHLSPGTIVVYESTVYPGVTEDICVPILEEASGLKCGVDFKVGYSPERINPSDKEHTLPKITKVVSGMDDQSRDLLGQIYGEIIEAGIYLAPNIKTAEGAKVIENIQRDLNIALMNELSIIFDKLGLDTREVLAAAGTKWNFIKFEPGLVGGHCIGVDPYYLTHRAKEIGYNPDVILAGRSINDRMGAYLAEKFAGMIKGGNRALILGLTFKENIGDIRNTRVVDIHRHLAKLQIEADVYDPHALPEEVEEEYGIRLLENLDGAACYSGIIMAVKHQNFVDMEASALRALCDDAPVFMDVKGVMSRDELTSAGFDYWRL